jgi:hypothetical protein
MASSITIVPAAGSPVPAALGTVRKGLAWGAVLRQRR